VKQVFVDLDSLTKDVVTVRFEAKEYGIKPPTAIDFMKYANAIVEIQQLMKLKPGEFTEEDVLNRYSEFISSVCPEFPVDRLIHMSRIQVSALLQVIIDFTSGRMDDNGDVKKKTVAT
jgi:hypothetical protein